MKFDYKIGVIGAGNMAKAIVNGIVKKGIVEAGDIIVSDPIADISVQGVKTIKDNIELLNKSEYVILAIKPQVYKTIKNEIDNNIKAHYLISIMAGIPLNILKDSLPDNVKTFRGMPNTPCMLGKGVVVLAENEYGEKENKFISEIFGSTGEVIFMNEEKFHTVTSVSGSGPAYIYMFIEGMIKSGMEQGLDYNTAKKMVLATFNGALGMVSETETPIEELIAAVCSKGGTTIEAVNSFKEDGLYGIIDKAMQKCRNRSEELSKMQ